MAVLAEGGVNGLHRRAGHGTGAAGKSAHWCKAVLAPVLGGCRGPGVKDIAPSGAARSSARWCKTVYTAAGARCGPGVKCLHWA